MSKCLRGLAAAALLSSVSILSMPAMAAAAEPDPAAATAAALPDEYLLATAEAAEAAEHAPPAVVLAETRPEPEPEPQSEPVVVRALAPLEARRASRAGPLGGLTFSANVALASEYRFRGVNLSGGDIALQGGFDVAHDSGFYAGTWASTLDNDTVGYGALEVDLYGGWSGDVVEGLTANVGFIAYTYPDAPRAGDFDYYEVYGSLAFTLGPVSTTVGIAYDPEQNGLDFGGLKRDNLYTYGDVNIGIPGTPLTVSGHLGYTDGALSFETDSKSWDWSLGVSLPVVGPLTASLMYVDAEADVAPGAFNPTSSTVVAKLSAKF